MRKITRKLVREIVRGKPYEYYSLGEHVVAHTDICGGRPDSSNISRIEVQVVLNLIASGEPLDRLLKNFNSRVSKKAVEESLRLGGRVAKTRSSSSRRVIVLDENLQPLGTRSPIVDWYPGRVCYVADLDPGVVIKDAAIPAYLRQLRGATFVTTNVSDFWRRVRADTRFCVVCLALPNERLREVPNLLRSLFRMSELKTKAARLGKVVRAAARSASILHDKG